MPLWDGVCVLHPHGRLGDYEGWYVAWRGSGVHVSAPSWADASDMTRLRATGVPELQDPLFWRDFALQRGRRVVGPATHHYLDEDPGVPQDVEQVDPVRLMLLRDAVSSEDWEESGIPQCIEQGGEALAVWGTTGDARRPWVPALLGGAALTEIAGANRDIGLLVADDARGRGVGRSLWGRAPRRTRSRGTDGRSGVAGSRTHLAVDRRPPRVRALRDAARVR